MKSHCLVLSVLAPLLLAACSRDPAKASRRYIESGDRYAKAGQFKEAAIEYRNAIKRTPQSVDAHAKLAEVSGRANDPDTAVRETLRVAQIAKEQLRRAPEVDDTLGRIYYRRNQPHEAIGPLSKSVAARPDNALYRYHLGMAYGKSGSPARARDELGRALSLAPSFPGRDEALRARAQLETVTTTAAPSKRGTAPFP